MKKILFAAIAALAITGCSQNEEMENLGKNAEINFTPIVNKSARAAAADLASLKTTGFQVYAYNTGATGDGVLSTPIIPGVKVSFANPVWTLAGGPYYWPSDSNVGFFAYAPAASKGAVYAVTTPAADTAPTITYTVPAVADQEDFLVAQNPKQTVSENGVALSFTHALCQVNFSVVGEDALTYTVSKIEIVGVVDKGTYKFGGSWTTVAGETGDYSYPLATPNPSVTGTTAVPLDQLNGALMLLPQTFTDSEAVIKVSYVVTDSNNNTVYTATDKDVPLKGTKAWTISKKMRYTLTLTNGAKEITFGEPSVGDWDEDSEAPSVPK